MIIFVLLLSLQPVTAAAADKTSKYRVYQNDQLLMEFFDYRQAESYAKQYLHSHIEEIGSRTWVWNNFPRYRVYQQGLSLPEWEFTRLDDAITEAGHWTHSSVRDLQSSGWEWNNYPHYRLYQGDMTLDAWEFSTLDAAKAEASHWSNSHLIDLRNNRWVWDNLSEASKSEQRAGKPIYQIYQLNFTSDAWKFAYLEDAVQESLKWSNSVVVNSEKQNAIVFSNLKTFQVFQNDSLLDAFVGLDEAISYAGSWAHATIKLNGKAIWTNNAFYSVFQNNNRIGEFRTILDAVNFGLLYSNASIRNELGSKLWNNDTNLIYWGWNGVSNFNTIKTQVNNTIGLDIDSPSWFELADAGGGLKDNSNKDTITYLKARGNAIHPLVSNQFNATLTTQFLSSPDAQTKFIQALVNRCVQLNVDGINIDFESLAGKDRANFTAFIQNLSEYAHVNRLVVSLDLPRGSVKWNQLTAFDHEKLVQSVDYIMTMAYDQYYSGSLTPGSVAGLPWVEEGIQEFLSYGIPRDKLMLGIPFYTREWTMDDAGKLISNAPLHSADIPTLLAAKSTKTTWDDEFKQYKVEYVQDGLRHVFWQENEETLKARIELAKKYKLAGVAAWRLGHESPEVWKMMLQQK